MTESLDSDALVQKVREITGWRIPRLVLHKDTSDPMRINRGDIVRLAGKYFVIRGNMFEPRFGIDDQPKYWVMSATDLETAEHKIIKTIFQEDFYVRIGILRIHCYRSPEKESSVLELTRGDDRFMQGYSTVDENNNNVRIIDFIKGNTLFKHIPTIEENHEQYYHESLPQVLKNLSDSIQAIEHLHKNGFCHGDIRNDHIIIDTDTGLYRWIDFDLKQDVNDFDMWSIGNILNYVVGKGIVTFKRIMKSREFADSVKKNLLPQDGSAFYEYRIMNLGKVFPYISNKLNEILLHFTIQPRFYYNDISQFVNEYHEFLESEF